MILNLFFLIQNGPSKPDEIFGGSSGISDFFTIVICGIVLLIFLFFGIMKLFSSETDIDDGIDREAILIENSKKVVLRRFHVINHTDRNELIEIVLHEVDKNSALYDQSKLLNKLNLLSDDDIRRVYYFITKSYYEIND